MRQSICQICKTGNEDLFHALKECKMAWKIWKCTHVETKTQEIIREDTLSVTHRLMGTVAENELEFVTAILCYFRSLKKKKNYVVG